MRAVHQLIKDLCLVRTCLKMFLFEACLHILTVKYPVCVCDVDAAAEVEFKGNIPKEVVNECAVCFQLSDSMELNCSTGEWENNLPISCTVRYSHHHP